MNNWFVGLIFDVNLSMFRLRLPIIISSVFIWLIVFSCQKEEIGGCTSLWATNYNADATFDDGTCVYDTSSYPPPSAADFDGDISTSWTDNWNDWDIYINGVHGTVGTSWTNDWNDWDFEIGGISGDISTSWTNNWNDWTLTATGYNIDISTSWTDNWNDWELNNGVGPAEADVSTSWTNNWNDWDVLGDSVNINMDTDWSNNWNDWDVDGTFGSTLPIEYKVTVMFVPIIASVLKAEGIIP